MRTLKLKLNIVIFFIILVIALSGYGFSKEIDYSDVDETLLNLNIHSSFEIEPSGIDPTISTATITMELYPATDYRQELVYLDTQGTAQNNQIIFTYKNPSISKHTFSYDAKVRVKNEFKAISKKIPFPLETGYEYSNTEYTKPTEYMDFDKDERIRNTATQLATGEDDLYVIVYKLSKWVTDNIEYDLSIADTVEKASTTMTQRKGVCDEATILFIAMARSLGIPTKYVSGVAYTNLENINDWGAHAWAEVYFKDYGWIPFDFTYQQYGFVDASHIKLKDSGDANEPSVKYEWMGHDAELTTQDLVINTAALSVTGDKENPISISARPLHTMTGPESYNAVEVTVKNLKNNYFTTNLYLSKTPSIVGKNNQVILLKPLEEKKLYWIIYSNLTIEDPSKYYIYTLEASSLHISDEKNYTVRAKEVVYSISDIQEEISQLQKESEMDENKQIIFSCSNKNSFYDYEPVIVECNIINNGNLQNNLKLCLIDDCETFNLANKDQKYKKYSFFMTDAKKYSIKAILENKNIYKVIPIEFEVIKRPKINITITSKPSLIDYDSWYGIQFRIDKDSTLYNTNVTFTLNDYSQVWYIDTFEVPREYKITLKADNVKSGNNSFYIDVAYHDANGNLYNTRYSDYIIVNKLKFFQKIKYYLVKFITNIEHLVNK